MLLSNAHRLLRRIDHGHHRWIGKGTRSLFVLRHKTLGLTPSLGYRLDSLGHPSANRRHGLRGRDHRRCGLTRLTYGPWRSRVHNGLLGQGLLRLLLMGRHQAHANGGHHSHRCSHCSPSARTHANDVGLPLSIGRLQTPTRHLFLDVAKQTLGRTMLCVVEKPVCVVCPFLIHCLCDL